MMMVIMIVIAIIGVMIGIDQIQLPLPPQFLPMPHHTIHPPAATTPHHPNAVPADVGQQRTITGGSTKPNNLFQLPDGRVLIVKIHNNPFMMIRKCPPHSTPINMAAVIITTAATTTPLHPRNEAYVKILNNSNTMMNDTGHHNTNSSTSSKNRTSPNNGRIIQSGGAAGTAAVVVAFGLDDTGVSPNSHNDYHSDNTRYNNSNNHYRATTTILVSTTTVHAEAVAIPSSLAVRPVVLVGGGNRRTF